MRSKTLGDIKGEAKAKAMMNALVDTLAGFVAE